MIPFPFLAFPLPKTFPKFNACCVAASKYKHMNKKIAGLVVILFTFLMQRHRNKH